MASTTAYVYIVQCADSSYYIGWTNDLQKRLNVHNAGRGSKYTRARLPVNLVYFEKHSSQNLARSREVQLKKLSRKQKSALIAKAMQKSG